jgi:signal peptidase II
LSGKVRIFLGILTSVLVLDLWTKSWALDALADRSMELFGGLVPLTLAFNRGAAFGISIGDDPRWVFIPISIVAVILLASLLRQASNGDLLRIVSVSLVMAGALGNLYDRVRWSRGVVDFIGPIDLGFMDWPIFNVADMSISCGAVLLALSFWMEEQEEPATESARAETSSTAEGAGLSPSLPEGE